MKIFVYEHVTGGGMSAVPPPPGMLHEADLMVRTLIEDLGARADVELLTSRDARLAPVPGAETLRVGANDDPHAIFAQGILASDAVWPIAPETGHALEELSREVLRRGRILLGSRPDAVSVSASKRQTVRTLAAAGISAVPTFVASEPLPRRPGRWVTKPDDGAGAENTRLVDTWQSAMRQLQADPGRLVAQPWLEGTPISLSLLCHGGESLLICCNRQRLQMVEGAIALAGIAVNAVSDPSGELAALGESIATALPGLWGYVGVDLVLAPEGPVVLEVNPRLTTSYCGIRRALDVSVAAMVLDLLEPGVAIRGRGAGVGSVVELHLGACRDG